MRKFSTFASGMLTGVALVVAVRLVVHGPPRRGFDMRGVPPEAIRPVEFACPPGYTLHDFDKNGWGLACVQSDSLPPAPDSSAAGRGDGT